MSEHQAIEPAIREQMNAVGDLLRDEFPGRTFALLVFEGREAPAGRMNYLSNADRKDMLMAMREFIDKNEQTFGEVEPIGSRLALRFNNVLHYEARGKKVDVTEILIAALDGHGAGIRCHAEG